MLPPTTAAQRLLQLYIDFHVFVIAFLTAHSSHVYVQVYEFPFLPPPPPPSTHTQMRITMKSYSFIRENAYKVLYPWNKDDDDGPAVWYEGQMSPKVASFSQYVYFFFAPTLLYRDHYPRYSDSVFL